MKEACEAFETPVVSGNVSFYNETDGRGILPTPTIGMVGLIEDTRKIVTHGFKSEGDIIALLGVTNDDLSVSEYAQTVLGRSTEELIATGRVPQIDLRSGKTSSGHLPRSCRGWPPSICPRLLRRWPRRNHRRMLFLIAWPQCDRRLDQAFVEQHFDRSYVIWRIAFAHCDQLRYG